MVIISSPSFKEYIIETLENYQGDVTFKHVETQGMNIKFSCSKEEESSAVLAKQIIKASEKGSVLYFQAKFTNE
ncbi:MAG: hypothetical protein ACRDBX_07810 [Erysipelotrichaceae bacterium]